MEIIGILSPKQSEPETAEQLAQEHARAKQEYETRRLSVLGRADRRRQDLLDLANEARAEAEKHQAIVNDLQQ